MNSWLTWSVQYLYKNISNELLVDLVSPIPPFKWARGLHEKFIRKFKHTDRICSFIHVPLDLRRCSQFYG